MYKLEDKITYEHYPTFHLLLNNASFSIATFCIFLSFLPLNLFLPINSDLDND